MEDITNNQDLIACQADLAQVQEKFMYLTADFDNYRRRVEKEKIQWSAFAQEAVLRDLLDVVDNFERSATELASNAGFELIYKSCKKMLTKYGVEEITQIANFDPKLHEAIMSVTDETQTSGTIVQVLEKGYMFKGSVLRPAKVSVVQ